MPEILDDWPLHETKQLVDIHLKSEDSHHGVVVENKTCRRCLLAWPLTSDDSILQGE